MRNGPEKKPRMRTGGKLYKRTLMMSNISRDAGPAVANDGRNHQEPRTLLLHTSKELPPANVARFPKLPTIAPTLLNN